MVTSTSALWSNSIPSPRSACLRLAIAGRRPAPPWQKLRQFHEVGSGGNVLDGLRGQRADAEIAKVRKLGGSGPALAGVGDIKHRLQHRGDVPLRVARQIAKAAHGRDVLRPTRTGAVDGTERLSHRLVSRHVGVTLSAGVLIGGADQQI